MVLGKLSQKDETVKDDNKRIGNYKILNILQMEEKYTLYCFELEDINGATIYALKGDNDFSVSNFALVSSNKDEILKAWNKAYLTSIEYYVDYIIEKEIFIATCKPQGADADLVFASPVFSIPLDIDSETYEVHYDLNDLEINDSFLNNEYIRELKYIENTLDKPIKEYVKDKVVNVYKENKSIFDNLMQKSEFEVFRFGIAYELKNVYYELVEEEKPYKALDNQMMYTVNEVVLSDEVNYELFLNKVPLSKIKEYLLSSQYVRENS